MVVDSILYKIHPVTIVPMVLPNSNLRQISQGVLSVMIEHTNKQIEITTLFI